MLMPAYVLCLVPYVTSSFVTVGQLYQVGHQGLPPGPACPAVSFLALITAVFISILLCLFVSFIVCLLHMT